jgi:hypothetical protein
MSENINNPAISTATDYKDRDVDSDTPGTPPAKIEDVELIGASTIVDKETEKRLLRKLDLRIIPMVCWIYLNNFIDRVNIGNARLYWLERDLNMAGNQFQLAVSLLFVTYVVSQAVRLLGYELTLPTDFRNTVEYDYQEAPTCALPDRTCLLLGHGGYVKRLC